MVLITISHSKETSLEPLESMRNEEKRKFMFYAFQEVMSESIDSKNFQKKNCQNQVPLTSLLEAIIKHLI